MRELLELYYHTHWPERPRYHAPHLLSTGRTQTRDPPKTARGRSLNNSTHTKAVTSGRNGLPGTVLDVAATPKTGGHISTLLTTRIPTRFLDVPVRPSPYARSEHHDMTYNGAEGSKPPFFSPCDSCDYAACDANNCAIQSVKESEMIFGGLAD